ncbi:type I restriction-modification enzyme R subunit C-terminal domain-containing protein [Steroidobacter cummioxidans]|uniref:type I restriction-modification enzyme R subunit C-terminal domain-containing protein n=1 Tax=Steroidobacter cummioxidans TaxID=1803913 RepID=UPI0019D42994|nr:type I restriction-modification enzyme R subunit C-terminal domain-containing protein [Steroidobacter cummioxidans]
MPPRAVSVPLKFQREGIRYDDLSEDDKDQWDALEWDGDDGTPDHVEAEAVNKWLFNKDTVDKVLEHLMTRGLTVAGGDRLGKTIIFAKNQAHADFIAERFNINYPHYRGEFASVITFKTEYAQTLIDNFSIKDRPPHIAISVDMLDTGVDVPEVVNLVFFKLVRSKTKFWQMIGRGTRLSESLFGPGKDKEFFFLFDYCQNLEYFSQNLPATDGRVADALGTKLFKSRVELVAQIDEQVGPPGPGSGVDPANVEDLHGLQEKDVRSLTAARLLQEIESMNLENFVIRPKRRLVEKYAKRESWNALSPDDRIELTQSVAILPTQMPSENEEAKRFDLLLLKLQLAVLRSERAFERLRDQVKEIAALLEEKASIPMVSAQMPLILEVQSDEYWQDVKVGMLEALRRRLRDLVQLIDKVHRKPLYSDFEDEMGSEVEFDLPQFKEVNDLARFRAKAQAFLRAHQDHVAVNKVRMNKPLTPVDLSELERMLVDSGVGARDDLERAATQAAGLGLFVRSLVGLDRGAAKDAFGEFLRDTTFSGNQIEFINLIVNHLTEHGVMDAARLYESPFTDLTPQGPDGLFNSHQVDRLVVTLEAIRAAASAA